MIQVDLQNVRSFIPLPYEAALSPRLRIAHDRLQSGSGAGGEFTGWVRLPEDYDKAEFTRIKAAAQRIRSDSQALVVIGIGGSYLGARGVIECLRSPNYNLKKKDTPNIYFIGNGLSSDALTEVMELVDGVDFSVNVISKSGTTTEPAVAFRFFRELLEKKYGAEGAASRIYATTDAHKGALKSLADQKGYEEFVVPDDVGGRYSVLTAVGLLPIAVAGIDDPNGFADQKTPQEVARDVRDAIGDGFWLLLAHRNTHFETDYAALGADLTLSGHGHGGLWRLPFTDGLLGNGGALLPSYTNGFYTCRGADVFVTRGLGGMVRILNRPEVAVVILRRN